MDSRPLQTRLQARSSLKMGIHSKALELRHAFNCEITSCSRQTGTVRKALCSINDDSWNSESLPCHHLCHMVFHGCVCQCPFSQLTSFSFSRSRMSLELSLIAKGPCSQGSLNKNRPPVEPLKGGQRGEYHSREIWLHKAFSLAWLESAVWRNNDPLF